MCFYFTQNTFSQNSLQKYEDACIFEHDIDDWISLYAGADEKKYYSFNEGIAFVEFRGKWGAIDTSGNEVIPFKYDLALSVKEGLAAVQLDKKWGFVNKQGALIIPNKYNEAYSFKDGVALIKTDSKYGVINKTGSIIVPAKYDYRIGEFSEGLGCVYLSTNKKYGYVNQQGILSIPAKYDHAETFSEGLAAIGLNDNYGYINRQGIMSIAAKYEYADNFSEGLAVVKLNGKYGYIDKQGSVIIPFNYDGAFRFSEGLAKVLKGRNYGFIDSQGNTVIPFTYERSDEFSEGLACCVKTNGKYGYIDKQGKEIVPFVYEEGNNFSEGFACVKKNGKYGYINKLGKEITPFIFDLAENFSNGLACISIEGKRGYIDKNGEPIAINFSGRTYYDLGLSVEKFIGSWMSEKEQKENYKAAFSWFMKGAIKDDSNCCYSTGIYYYYGNGIDKNYQEAVKWLEKAKQINSRNGDVYRFIGYCYNEGGFGITKDDAKAFHYFSEGAKYKNEGCYYALAVSYVNGIGCDVNIKRACFYADELYNLNRQNYVEIYGDCYNSLAYAYAKNKDYTQAISSIDKAINANPANANFYDSKGEILLMMEKEEEALKLWNKVVELSKDHLEFYINNSILYKQLKAKGLIQF